MKKQKTNAGFTLIELLVSLGIFMVVGGTALGLVSKSIPLYSRQEGMTVLNIGLRSAVAQMEQDLENAGSGYYTGPSVPAWPIGVTIANTAGGSCYDSSTYTYGANCFDVVNVVMIDQGTPQAKLDASYSTTDTTFNVVPPAGYTASTYKDKLLTNDQVFLLRDNGSQLTTVRLTADGAENGASVLVTHAATNADGTNTCNSPCNDPWSFTTHLNNNLSSSFDSDDWVLKLAPVQWYIDASDATNPKLMRKVGLAAGEVVAEQIIGFKVGAAIWNDSDNGTDNYIFDASAYPDDPSPAVAGNGAYNFSRVRSVRISLIGRTKPSTDRTYSFRNTFDGGPYQIQSVSVVVNPRNLSMKEQQP